MTGILKDIIKLNDTSAQLSVFSTDEGVAEYHLLISVTDNTLPFQNQLNQIQKAYKEIVSNHIEEGAVAAFKRYFVSDAANQSEEISKVENELSFCPYSIVQQAPLDGSKIALWVYLIGGKPETKIHESGMLEVYAGGHKHYWRGGMTNKASNSEYQTRLLLSDYVMNLAECGCTLAKNCVRTWLFTQNVDVNYAGVVTARREFFETQGLTDKTHYISSTGIEGRHADQDVLVQLDAYAVGGLQDGQMKYLYAPTHLNPTYEYGVTFERGTTVSYSDRKHIYISGTASIDNRGDILYPGDIVKQTERMMENISVLLAEAGATTKDVVQAIVYLRDSSDYAVVKSYLDNNFSYIPHVIVHAPVCRPGWLIETECISIIPERSHYGKL